MDSGGNLALADFDGCSDTDCKDWLAIGFEDEDVVELDELVARSVFGNNWAN